MEMQLVTMKLSEIHPYERNPRRNDPAVASVVESIQQCTYVAPIVVDEDGVILAGHSPERPMEGALRLVVKWCFPRKEHRDGEYRSTKPDTDNLNKLLKDCMTAAGFWKDDAQVASEIVEKFWAKVPGIYVCVEELHRRKQGEQKIFDKTSRYCYDKNEI